MNDQWWIDFYDGEYVDVVLTTDTEKLAVFITEITGLSPGDVVFDQCCGRGTVSASLAKDGCRVYGCDMASGLINRANRDYGMLDCKFYVADARMFLADEKADLGLNWNTSFAYSECDADNLSMLETFACNIKPNGQFLISTMNPLYVTSHFQKFIVKEVPYHDSSIITIRESFIENGMLKSKWTIVYPDGHRLHRHGQTKMYGSEQLIEMLRRYGLDTVSVYGDLYKNPCTSETQHIILHGYRR